MIHCLVRLIIEYINDESQPSWKGYMYVVSLFIAVEIRSILLHQYFKHCFTVGMRIRSGIIAAVYKKVPSFLSLVTHFIFFLSLTQALALSNKARRTKTVGEIVNLMSVDAQRFMDIMTYLHIIWSGPLQTVLSLVFLYITLGPSIFAGLAVIILLVPVNALIANVSKRFQAKLMKRKDVRIKLINELLNGIKVSQYFNSHCDVVLYELLGYQIICLGETF